MSVRHRLLSAHDRYGWRAAAVATHKLLFQWPRTRSKLVELKLGLLLECNFGHSVRFGKGVFVGVPGGKLGVGRGSYIGDRCHFEISANPKAELLLGKHCYLAHDVHVTAMQAIRIGDDVQIAEFVSLRDTTHNYRSQHLDVYQQGDTRGTITIGNDVWLGKGSLVLGSVAGTSIGRGAVIGAHSVVKSSIPEYAIAVGAPARVVGYRE